MRNQEELKEYLEQIKEIAVTEEENTNYKNLFNAFLLLQTESDERKKWTDWMWLWRMVGLQFFYDCCQAEAKKIQEELRNKKTKIFSVPSNRTRV